MRLCNQTLPNDVHLADGLKKKQSHKQAKNLYPQNFSTLRFPKVKYLTLQLQSSFSVFVCVCVCSWKERCYINIDYSINTLNTVKQMQVYAKPSLTECFSSSHRTQNPIFGYKACSAASYTVI